LTARTWASRSAGHEKIPSPALTGSAKRLYSVFQNLALAFEARALPILRV